MTGTRQTISTADNDLYIQSIGPDRRLAPDGQPGICLTLNKVNEQGKTSRFNVREKDLLAWAEDTNDPTRAVFATKALEALHQYQKEHPNRAELPIVQFEAPVRTAESPATITPESGLTFKTPAPHAT